MEQGIFIKVLKFGYDKHNRGKLVSFEDVKKELKKCGYTKYNDKSLSIFFYQNFYHSKADHAIKTYTPQSGKDGVELMDLSKYYPDAINMKSEGFFKYFEYKKWVSTNCLSFWAIGIAIATMILTAIAVCKM